MKLVDVTAVFAADLVVLFASWEGWCFRGVGGWGVGVVGGLALVTVTVNVLTFATYARGGPTTTPTARMRRIIASSTFRRTITNRCGDTSKGHVVAIGTSFAMGAANLSGSCFG